MNEIFKLIFSLSISGTLLMLMLYFFHFSWKKRLGKQWQYYIWLIVIARLLLPFSPKISLIGNFFLQVDQRIEQENTDLLFWQESISISPNNFKETNTNADNQTNTITKNQTNTIENRKADIAAESQLDSKSTKISKNTELLKTTKKPLQEILSFLVQNVWIIWLFIALILFIRKITIYQDFVKYIQAGCMPVEEIAILEALGKIAEKNKVKGRIELCTNNLISSPMLIGFFRPYIVLPNIDFSDTDFQYIILHELTHYKRKDMFYKWLVQFTICVHWFNPFVYLMEKEINKACELSCDEAVIQKLDKNGRRAYGDTLLNAMKTERNYKNRVVSVTLNESKELLKERLEMIMNFKKKSGLTLIITILLTIFFTAGATVFGASATTSKSTSNVKQEKSQSSQKRKLSSQEQKDKTFGIIQSMKNGQILIEESQWIQNY